MTTNNAVSTRVVNAQAKPPAKHTAATVAPQRDREAGYHHYPPEAIGAMTAVGVVGIFGCAVALLLFIKLVRWTFGGTRRDSAVRHG